MEDGTDAPTSAYEFLHVTFGEFLTADFVLRQVVREVQAISALAGEAALADTLRQRLAVTSRTWLGCLMYTSLHTRPVVLQMLAQWGAHQLKGMPRPRAELLRALDTLVIAQLRAALADAELPDIVATARDAPYPQLPFLGHLAIYTLNLVLLRTYLTDDGAWTLAGADLGGEQGGVPSWDRLNGLWRSWFPVDSLSSLGFNVTADPAGTWTISIWDPRTGAQGPQTEPGTAETSPRPLAGVANDSPSDVDLLRISNDVETLAELITATETEPPLAIALVGNWGVGKSSMMMQIEKHIRRLSDRAREARENDDGSAWAETVRHIRFNAWNYSDDRLWAGLVSHLSEVLAEQVATEAKQDAADGAKATAKITEIKSDLARERRKRDQLDADLKKVKSMRRPAGLLGWLESLPYGTRTLLATARQALRDVRAASIALLAAVVLGAGIYAAWHYAHGWIASVVTAVTAVTVLVVPPIALVARKIRELRSQGDKQLANLDARLQAYEQRIQSLEEELRAVDEHEQLAWFLADKAKDGTYQAYRGLLGEVRVHLTKLAAYLAAARKQWEQSERHEPPPLERIVLYIDDLDRCPPPRVVEVLEAVHLMLALDLFVVIVAVDARWLIRSLEHHHHELFRRGDGSDDDVAMPVDYLDKIFQIPFTLPPPVPGAMADYLRSLLPEPVTDLRVDLMEAESGGAADTENVAGISGAAEESEVKSADAASAEDRTPLAEPADADDTTEPGPARPEAAAGSAPGRDTAPERDVRSQHAAAEASSASVIELRPLHLQVTEAEVTFMTQLGRLVGTPRMAKRLVNLYRLVRIGIPDEQLATFVGDGGFQVVQILLAILAGHPVFAEKVFSKILDVDDGPGDSDDVDLAAIVDMVGDKGDKAHSFGIIHSFLLEIKKEAPIAASMSQCRYWCPRLARFSFYTRDLARAGVQEER